MLSIKCMSTVYFRYLIRQVFYVDVRRLQAYFMRVG